MMKMSPSEISILKYCAFSNHLKKKKNFKKREGGGEYFINTLKGFGWLKLEDNLNKLRFTIRHSGLLGLIF